MSHFTVLVIGRGVKDKLALYDENTEVTPYIRMGKEELEKERKELIEEAKNPPQDPVIDYSVYTDKMSLADFAKTYHALDIDEKGNILTTYNPKSKWDWYAIGGRWKGLLTTKSGKRLDQARLNQLCLDEKTFFTFAVITKDGRWHESGKMGWFGCSSESEEKAEEWKKSFWDRFMKGLSEDTLLTVIDCHI